MTPDVGGYEALAGLLRDQITSGELAPGQQVPSELELVQRYGLARDTVRRAVALLRSEGLVAVRRGYGVVVFDRPPPVEVVPPAGSVVECRSPTPAERRDLAIPEGWPLIVVSLPARSRRRPPDGAGSRPGEWLLPADRFRVRVAGG